MKRNILLCIAMISVFSFNIYSQKAKLANADKKYDNYAYIDAIKTYEKVAEKGYKSAPMFQKIGNAYYFNGELDKAVKWYAELFAMPDTVIEPTYYYRYAQSLRAIGENNKADQILKEFDKISADDSRAKLFKANTNYLDEIKANSGRHKIENAGINSQYSDYGSSIYNNKIVFTSARDTGSLGQRKHSWTDQHFTNLYSADLDDQMSPSNPVKAYRKLNSKFNEATPVFTKDGKTVYFTRNNYMNGKKGKNENGITLIKLYKATLEGEKWINIQELPFDSDNYSTAHPTLSPDEKTLYFASDMPGTLGMSDIFKVQINEDGSFGTPVNLGPAINTEGRETFPFVSQENELYFASDGHPGVGGLDIFMTKINDDGSFNRIQNIGMDANSPKDDFAYIIDSKSRKGFLSSNRDGGQGYDDIYKFLETRKLICEQELYGEITDKESKLPLPNSKIMLFDKKMNILKTVNADEKGAYSFMVECSKMYTVRAEKEGYGTNEKQVTIPYENGKTYLPIELEKDQCKVTVGDDLGKCFGIRNIYFDLDKSNIRTEAALDLEKILDVLNQYPSMKLDIRSHTDSRASFKYNEALSDRRAKSTINWLIKNGVSADRLTGKGYGETELVNKCSDGVKCTEEEHQMNRRSEFIITAL
ncbi:WD40-like Beta Propeller Repeat [Flavobacterium glycines]|uniref:Flagellar motor protein MotB n=2 Tax=Flavobacterium glycines TaxID=551990 RepID=A0A1B9DWE5_9FLAO|nr:OmpA family protein [Flavobacterium glycines]OCB73999.1 flagellar motor protein MotB [Flavobacterium glycines]SDJ92579.1 WD40-like Beta Propeller Repeat [Flavobacterium glycines]